MRKHDALGLPPVPVYSSESIRALRHRYHLSLAFATVLNTTLSKMQ